MESPVKFKMMFRPAQLYWLIILLSTTALADKVHVVYMGQTHSHLPGHEVTALHHTMLASTLGSAHLVQDSMIYSYKNSFSGFAAKLSPEHVTKLRQMDGVLSVFPNKAVRPQTSYSWEFLGLELPDFHTTKYFADKPADSVSSSLWAEANFGEDIIIGMIDTGIWPESKSFKDDGLSDIPERWKGACVEGQQFSPSNCNKKLIGAKYYNRAFEAEHGVMNQSENVISARDIEGHGTHTASTAGGSMVVNVSLNGYANGTAKGGAPKVRIAAYKVCWVAPANETVGPCFIADIMAAMDEAVTDGVDLISMSIAGEPVPNLFEDGMSIAAFHAVQKGVVVVLAGGNAGPNPYTVDHLDPWTLTVGASSLDRIFAATLQLGDSIKLQGETTTDYETINADLAWAQDLVAAGQDVAYAELCRAGTLDPAKTVGKIVFCMRGNGSRVEKGLVVKNAGGVGMILGNQLLNGDDVSADNHVLPALAVTATGALEVLAYIKNNSKPVATLFKGSTILGKKPSPVIASFSSVGPNIATRDILKPDIVGPGKNILAAWSGASSPSQVPGDDRRTEYNIISGTSMATPHVAGVVALLKAAHPDWSPSAIKSALMTTAVGIDNTHHRITDSVRKEANPFEEGAGNLNPTAASHPGLIYDTSAADYSVFLCSLGYNDTSVQIITGQQDVCSTFFDGTKRFQTPSDLNLASLTVGNLQGTQTIRRVVTNVDDAGSTYKVHVVPPSGVSVSIWPPRLKFRQAGEKKEFFVTLKMEDVTQIEPGSESYAFGSYTWYNSERKVRSVITVGRKG